MSVNFYDFFDTIVHRNCTSDELKLIWSEEIIEKLRLNIHYRELYIIRRKEEIYLYNTIKPYGEFKYIDLCKRIYFDLIYLRGSEYLCEKMNEVEFFEICLETEICIEKKFQYIDQRIVNDIMQHKARNEKVYIVSDFYLSENSMWEFVKYHGLNEIIDGIYVSSEIGYNKYTGTLYKYILKNLILNPSECNMTGDNLKSDYEIPKKMGMNVTYTGYKSDNNSIIKSMESKMTYISKKYRDRYPNYAYSLYLFIDRLYRELKKNGYKRVFFFSREGEMLRLLFEKYKQINGYVDIESDYLYVSRKATFIPSLKDLEEEDFQTIFREFSDISIYDFLQNLGLDINEIMEICDQIKYDANKQLEDIITSNELKQLKECKTFIDIYNKIRINQSQLFEKYLQQHGIDKKINSIAIVDVGWKGTIQDNIFKFMKGKLRIDGYYIGVLSGGDFCINNYKHGLLFSKLPYNSYMFDEWSYDHSWFERMLYASHPSTDSYEAKNGEIKPIYKSYESESKMYASIKPLQENITALFCNLCELFKGADISVELFEENFLYMHLQALFKEPISFMKLQNDLCSSQFENFGCNKSQKLVEKKRFSLRNMWIKRKKIFKAIMNFGKTNDINTICRVLEIKKMFIFVKIINFYVYNVRMKKLKRGGKSIYE